MFSSFYFGFAFNYFYFISFACQQSIIKQQEQQTIKTQPVGYLAIGKNFQNENLRDYIYSFDWIEIIKEFAFRVRFTSGDGLSWQIGVERRSSSTVGLRWESSRPSASFTPTKPRSQMRQQQIVQTQSLLQID